MQINDQQHGKPFREYIGTKAEIEALSLSVADEGCTAFATDTNKPGWFNGADWQWGGGGEGRTRRFFVPAVSANSASLYAQLSYGVLLADDQSRTVQGHFCVPADFVSDMTVSAVIRANTNGNVYVQNTAAFGEDAEVYFIHTVTTNLGAVTVSGGPELVNNVITPIGLAEIGTDDICSLQFVRDATNAADTLNADAYFVGWVVEYCADS